jgi:hypothetical protein
MNISISLVSPFLGALGVLAVNYSTPHNLCGGVVVYRISSDGFQESGFLKETRILSLTTYQI